MKTSILTCLLVVITVTLSSQSVKIYHGKTSTETRPIDLPSREITIDKGEFVEFEIINPNPILYSYEFLQSNTKQQDPATNYASVINFLNFINLLDGSSSSESLGGVASGSIEKTSRLALKNIKENSLTSQDSDRRESIQKLQNLISKIEETSQIFTTLEYGLKRSDNVKTYNDIINRNLNSNFNDFIFEVDQVITNIPSKISSLKASISDVEGHFAQEDTPEWFAYKVLIDKAKKINQDLENIRKKYDSYSKLPTSIIYRVKIDKSKKIKLKISAIHPTIKNRSTGDSIIIFTVKTNYERSKFEILPMATFSFKNNQSVFSVSDGIVNKDNKFKVSPFPSTSLNLNLLEFGELKEMSIGLSIGAGLEGNGEDLLNFNSGFLFSYKNIFRIGLGGGYAEFPESLKGASIGQSIPADISNIEELITFEKKASLFLNITFLGFTL